MSTESKRKSPKRKLAHPRESPEERRLSLAEAAIRSAAKYGTQGLSVRFIAREAGVSQSLITYHFGENDELILLAYSVLMNRFFDRLTMAIEAADGAEEKLEALIDTCTSPIEYNTEALATSIVFWGQILHSPGMREKFQRENERHIKLTTGLLSKLADEHEVAVGDVRLCAVSLFAMLDGLWLTWVLNPKSFNAADAREQGRKWLRAFRMGVF